MLLCAQCATALRENDRFCAACGAVAGTTGAAKDPLMGRTIGGSYVILDLVGVGGMGRVYRAEQRMLGRTVAIKVIHPHLLSDEQSVARFYNEARAASRLNHPNSVSIIDFGRTDDGILQSGAVVAVTDEYRPAIVAIVTHWRRASLHQYV